MVTDMLQVTCYKDHQVDTRVSYKPGMCWAPGKLQEHGTYSLGDPTHVQWLMPSSQLSIYIMILAGKKHHVSEDVPAEVCFDHLRALPLSNHWMVHIC